MAPAKRRVSYIIPAPTDPVQRLVLPPQNASRLGLVHPLLIRDSVQPPPDPDQHTRSRHPRHRLGVAALALDTSTQLSSRTAPEGILYTAGRDGLVLSWDLGLSLRPRTPSDFPIRRGRWEALTGWADDAIDEEGEEAEERPTSDGDILGDVTAVAARRRRPSSMRELSYEEQWELDADATPRASSFRQCVQAHTDWVNDIVLCNYNQTLVSASSDGTVQAWTPHAPGAPDPTTIGTHTDYVRCLAACRTQNWIASGSFDRTIKLWDLTRAQSSPNADPLITLHPADPHAAKSSVYALAADPFGHAVASGGPERVVRMWDPRTGKRSGKLVGHTDNIRAILLSEDAKYVCFLLPHASTFMLIYLVRSCSQAPPMAPSIKLWSLATQRCLHTFTHHADSVWSLFSAHPALETFYAGDRAGLVSRVDVSRITGDVGEGECVLVCRDGGEEWESPTSSELSPGKGGHGQAQQMQMQIRSQSQNLGQGGINKLIVVDDALVWTATSASTVRRWRIPARGVCTRRRHARPEWDLREGPRRSLAPSVLSYDDDGDDDGGETRHGIPYTSLVRLTSPNDPFPVRGVGGGGARDRDVEVATLYSAASVVSVPPLRSPLYQSASTTSHSGHVLGSPLRSAPLPSTRGAYFSRELAAEAAPLAPTPDGAGSIWGERGLVRALVLSDRIHAVSVDTGGEVGVWDLVRGVCVGVYGREALGRDASGRGAMNPNAAAGGQEEWSPREVLERVRERIEGEAVVAPWATVDTKAGVLAVHLNERSFESEIYADEVGYAGDRRFGDEAKLNIGKWVLRNLFLGFIREEQRTRRPRRDSTHSQDTASSAHHGSSHHQHAHRPSVSSDTSTRHRQPSFSAEPTSRPSRRSSSGNSTVVCAPKMLPAVQPAAASTVPQGTSPLLTPLIPLYGRPSSAAGTGAAPGLLSMPAIPGSPAIGVNDATPMPMQPQRRTRTATLDNGVSKDKDKDPGDYFGSRARQVSIQGGTASSAPDDFSGWSGPGSASAGGGGSFGKSKRAADIATPALPTTVEVPVVEETAPEPAAKTPLQLLLSGPLTPPPSSEAPTLGLSPHILLLIEEEAAPGFTTVYRGTVGSTAADAHILEESMPLWLVEYLLLHRMPSTPPQIKISFVLLPWVGKDSSEEQLPELLNTTQSKLTASRFLRVQKLVVHVCLVSATAFSPVDSSIILCAGARKSWRRSTRRRQMLRGPAPRIFMRFCATTWCYPLDMSIAAVRQFVWRQSTELTMCYRRNREMSAYRGSKSR
ncbi:WD-REPEATS-REGION domain-containing protein [Mycena venus]|uniref:WD-REPEATS-REGION domain-containing protein n=1 Tax=Mycena venus TaxID=2733690 RepID=A0A8H6YBB9_9AGAR|nr:WD-REPEATS-REGION domain-containing protein [Mycena venus]